MQVGFPAAHSLHGLEPATTSGGRTGNDFVAVFHFETAVFAYPGLIIDDDVRDEIVR